MDFGISGTSTIKFFNKDTNEEVFSTDCINSIFDVQIEREYTPTFKLLHTTKTDITLNLGNVKVEELLATLTKDIPTNQLIKMEISGTNEIETKEQVKKHKKKRINKKWLKRYGYKIKHIPVSIEIPNCHISQIKDEEVTTYEISTYSK